MLLKWSGLLGRTPRGKRCVLVKQVASNNSSTTFVDHQTGAELYREVKRAMDGVLGVVSQCFVATKAGIGAPPKRRDQYCAKCASSTLLVHSLLLRKMPLSCLSDNGVAASILRGVLLQLQTDTGFLQSFCAITPQRGDEDQCQAGRHQRAPGRQPAGSDASHWPQAGRACFSRACTAVSWNVLMHILPVTCLSFALGILHPTPHRSHAD